MGIRIVYFGEAGVEVSNNVGAFRVIKIEKYKEILDRRAEYYKKISKESFDDMIFQNYMKDIAIGNINKSKELIIFLDYLKNEGFEYLLEIESQGGVIKYPMKKFDYKEFEKIIENLNKIDELWFDYEKGLIKTIEKENNN